MYVVLMCADVCVFVHMCIHTLLTAVQTLKVSDLT